MGFCELGIGFYRLATEYLARLICHLCRTIYAKIWHARLAQSHEPGSKAKINGSRPTFSEIVQIESGTYDQRIIHLRSLAFLEQVRNFV